MAYVGIIIMIFCSVLNSVGQFLFKACVPSSHGRLGYAFLKNPKFLVGIAIYILGTLLSVYAYRFADLIVLYPLSNLALVWNLMFAGKIFGEKIDARRIVATGFILLGCAILVL